MHQSRLIELLREFAAIHGQDLSERLFQSLSGVTPCEITQHFSSWTDLRAAAGLPAKNGAGPRTTEADVRAAFQTALKKHGPRLTLQMFSAESGLCERVIYSRCGSWTRLRLSAGLPARANARQPAAVRLPAAGGRVRITPEQLLDRLRAEIREHGDNLSIQRFGRLTGYSQRLICARFGSWSNLRRAAGLTPHAKMTCRYTRDELLDDLLQVYQRIGADPKVHAYRCQGGRISVGTMLARFGSWPSAIAALHQHRLATAANG